VRNRANYLICSLRFNSVCLPDIYVISVLLESLLKICETIFPFDFMALLEKTVLSVNEKKQVTGRPILSDI